MLSIVTELFAAIPNKKKMKKEMMKSQSNIIKIEKKGL